MVKTNPHTEPIYILAFFGLFSAIAALPIMVVLLAVHMPEFAAFLSPGLVFGLAIAGYFVWREDERAFGKLFLFVSTCFAAFASSVIVIWQLNGVYPFQRGLATMGSADFDIPVPLIFTSAYLGAFLVFAGALLLFFPQINQWKSLGIALLCALAGGTLGIIGWKLGDFAAKALKFGGLELTLLYVVWQTGVAILLGVLVAREKTGMLLTSPSILFPVTDVAVHRKGVPIVAILFFSGVLVFLGFLAFRR